MEYLTWLKLCIQQNPRFAPFPSCASLIVNASCDGLFTADVSHYLNCY